MHQFQQRSVGSRAQRLSRLRVHWLLANCKSLAHWYLQVNVSDGDLAAFFLAPMENGLGVSKIRKALEDVRPNGMVSRVSVFE